MPSYYILALIASLVFFAVAIAEGALKNWIAWGLFFLALAQLLYGK